jgi:chorismate mutase
MDDLKLTCSRLGRDVEARIATLNAEISRYPGPIARCDAQLGGLLEERARLTRLVEALREFDAALEVFREPA